MSNYDKIRAKLQDRLQELSSRLDAIEGELESHTTRDWEDLATEREGDEVLERLGQTGAQEVARITAALGRIDAGTYGMCGSCGDQISLARLEAVPTAVLCRDCAAEAASSGAIGEEKRMDIYEKKAELLARINNAGEERHEFLPELQGLVRELESNGNTVSANIKYMVAELEDEAREAEMDNFPV